MTDESPTTLRTALDVLDFRRRVAEIYRTVRAAARPDEGHALWVRERGRLLAEHPASPVPAEHRGAGTSIEVAAYDEAFRFVVEVQDAPAERIEVVTGTDGTVVFDRVGRVELDGSIGGLGSLDVWWHGGYGGGVFVPLRDGTSGRTGYGGGRYVLDTTKGADLGPEPSGPGPARVGPGRILVVDLNFAYHPSCAYDPAWACPLAPPGNRLDADVAAGEVYSGPWAH